MLVLWSVKGGSGTTVVASMLAAALAQRATRRVRLVDLAGDVPAALGLAQADNDGLNDWLADTESDLATLCSLEIEAVPGLGVVPRGPHPLVDAPPERIAALMTTLRSPHVDTVIDAGSGAAVVHAALDHANRSLLVTRPCYLSLRTATRNHARIDGVILVTEPGRALGKRDVESVLRAPVVAEVPVSPQIARVVDAGLLASRVPADSGALVDLVA
jgi:MinD-like ATPase involved in chromosome partitioning or flagellar assembly